MISVSCVVLPVNSAVVVIAGVGSGQRMVDTHPGPKESDRKLVLFHPAFPFLFCHRAHLTTKIPTCILETTAPWDTLEILVQVVLMALYRFRIHRAHLSAFRLSPWNATGVRVGRGCSRLLPSLSGSRPHVEDGLIWTRADEEISFLQA